MTPKINEIRAAAVNYITHGFSVIPVGPDKVPLIKWAIYQERPPTIEEVVNWTNQFPNMQLGIVTGAVSGLVVVDVEAGGNHTQFPATAMAKTGGGGYHLYYKYPGKVVTNSVRIAELTDIRGDGGYVVAPPSCSDKGAYEWVKIIESAGLSLYPEYLIKKLSRQYDKQKETLVPVGERNIAATKKAGEILGRMKGAENMQAAWEELKDWNNTKVSEPLDEMELHKTFTSVSARENQKKAIEAETYELHPFTLRELYGMKFPPIEWLAQDLLPLGAVAAITGESNSYKSFLALSLATAITTGTDFLGHFPVVKGKVLIIDEENHSRFIEKRFKDMGVDPSDDIIFLSQTNLMVNNTLQLQVLQKLIDEIDPRLVILDSLVRFHSKDENSASEMRQVMKAIISLRGDKRSVLFIHHHKKEQGNSRSSGSNSVRGSTDIFNALDCHIGIKRDTNTITVRQYKLRVQQELEAFVVNIDNAGEHLGFIYGGIDNSRTEIIEETKADILIMLQQAEEPVLRKDMAEGIKVSGKILNEALTLLRDAKMIHYKTGGHNRHYYQLGPEPEEVTNTIN